MRSRPLLTSRTAFEFRETRVQVTQLCVGFTKPDTGGCALIIVPSLDLVIYKMGGNKGQYDPNFTTIPQPEPGTARDDWKPIQGTPFIEGSRGGDDGIRRVLEMVSAAVIP